MLGIAKNQDAWSWCASGKHPGAKDYFKVGAEGAILKAFVDWVERGYRRLMAGRGKDNSQNSWRFWAQGIHKKYLLCGIGKDSSDSLGRSFPLLILGTGPLKGWKKHWDLMPYALENTWNQIEYLASRRFEDLRQLENEIRKIPSPEADWSRFKAMRAGVGNEDSWTPGSLADPENSNKAMDSLPDYNEWFFPFEGVLGEENFETLNQWHFLLRQRLKNAPNAVFMGGIPEKTCLALFNGPLRPDDFIRLWSICNED